jgi:inorganic pyrophosphatase
MDALPSGLSVGESVLVGGRMLTVMGIGSAVEDLDGQNAVPVSFTDGSVVAYRPTARAKDDEEYDPESSMMIVEDLIEAAKRELQNDQVGRREVIRAKIKRLEARYQELRKEAAERRRATDEDGASSVTRRAQEVIDYHALPVRIESRQGDTRTGTTPDGVSWRTVMPADYGFIEGVDGADGDSIDCYVGPSPESSNVYVVDQHGLDGRGFDEHKVMLGYHTQESALEDYMLGHHLSGKTFAAVTAFTMPLFRKWLKTHDMTTPCNTEVTK